jgi:ABC-type multidrug transport system fused ATPase/permease subunit
VSVVIPSTENDPFRLRRMDIVKVVALGLGQAATLVAFLLLILSAVNALEPALAGESPLDRLTDLQRLGGLVLAAALLGVLRTLEFSLAEKAGYEVVRRVRMQMYTHLQGMSPRQFQHRARGGLVMRFTGDLSMLRMWLSRGLLGGVVALIVIVATTAVLALFNPWIALSLVAVLAGGAAVSLAGGRALRRATRTMRRRRSLLMSNVDEQLNALPVVQVFGRAGGEYTRLSRQNDSMNRSLGRVAQLRGRLRGVGSSVGLLAATAVLTVGLVELRAGRASLGLVVATVIVARQLDGPVRTLALAHDYWQRGRVSRQKLLEFLRSSTTRLDDPALASLRVRRGTVELRDVTVPGALSGVTLTAQSGQIVAVTGRSGAGKSTLLGLLARFVQPSSGQVVVDGQVLSETSPRSTYRRIGMVSADLPLMRGTVRRNITYRNPGATGEEIRRVVLATGLDEVLEELPEGITTWVVEGGRNLSAGQRQRIALARALLGNPEILLLDEPTAGLDPLSKQAVLDVVRHHHGTVLLVTHDADEIALADQVWRLERGQVAEVLSGEEHRDRLWLSSQKGAQWSMTTTPR